MTAPHRLRLSALVLGAVAVLCALAFPLAPVEQPRVEVSWTAVDGPTAIPLMPYQPVELSAEVSCAAARSAPDGAVVLSTIPLETDGSGTLPGLQVVRSGADVVFTSWGREVARDSVGSRCTWTVRSDPDRTAVARDGTELGSVRADVRPAVAGAFSEATGGVLALDLVTDTRFQTSVTPLKLAVGILGALALIGALVVVGLLDRISPVARSVPLLGPRWWRPRAVDGLVGAAGLGWLLIGPLTVDDGYIAGIIRGRDSNGFVGNMYRWLNAPEAPFGWFYEVMDLWAEVSTSMLWLRIPSIALTLVAWLLFSRGILPRLGTFARTPWVPWIAAFAFAAWTLPFALGLRPEPWVAVGVLATYLSVERARVTRRVLPLLLALVLAGLTTGVTPTGIVAFAPVLVSLVPLARILRSRTDLAAVPVVVLLLAAPGSAAFVMFADQSLAGVLEAIRVRDVIGGGLPWYEESKRYSELLTAGLIQGVLQRRAPVLLLLVGIVGAVWALRSRHTAGIARGPALRLYATLAISLALMTFTPTKWTYHFGALAGLGAAALVVSLQSWSYRGVVASTTPGMPRTHPVRTLAATGAGIAAVTLVAGLSFGGYNDWPSVSGDGVTWHDVVPEFFGIRAASWWLTLGGILVGLVVVLAVRHGIADDGRTVALLRRIPSTGLVALLLVVLVVLIELTTVARAAVQRRDTFTLAEDSLDSITGSTCGLADYLDAEPDPAAGLLPAVGAPGGLDGFAAGTVEAAGVPVPGFRSTTGGTMFSPWYRLDQSLRADRMPLVLTTEGERRTGDGIWLEFGQLQSGGSAQPVTEVGLPEVPGAPGLRDIRVDMAQVAPEADVVRVRGVDSAMGVPLAFSVPRSPRIVPMEGVVGTDPALVDWPIAFLFPCQRMSALVDGAAELPRWRVGTAVNDDAAARIEFRPETGGPFVTPRMLVRSQQVPLYYRGDVLRQPAALYRWMPVGPLAAPRITSSDETVSGWKKTGRATVPGLDS